MKGKGGYDEGYAACPCFWGTKPASLLLELATIIPDFRGLAVLDVGCGEGKNAAYLAERGAEVWAFDVSELAVWKAQALWPAYQNVRWAVADIIDVTLHQESFDIVVAYGLLHCLANEGEARRIIEMIKNATKRRGFNVICAFNSRLQDLSAHPGFKPLLLTHDAYCAAYADWESVDSSDSDLCEIHPHNGIPHTHALTRLLVRKP